jgi:hypothetical protein
MLQELLEAELDIHRDRNGEFNVKMVIQKKHLSDNERIIYRLAIKTWLGFDGCEESRQKLKEWEQSAYAESWKKICRYCRHGTMGKIHLPCSNGNYRAHCSHGRRYIG